MIQHDPVVAAHRPDVQFLPEQELRLAIHVVRSSKKVVLSHWYLTIQGLHSRPPTYPFFVEDNRGLLRVVLFQQRRQELQRLRRGQINLVQDDPLAVGQRFGQGALEELERERLSQLLEVSLHKVQERFELGPLFEDGLVLGCLGEIRPVSQSVSQKGPE